MRGEERHSGMPLTAAYAGSAATKNYIAKKLFRGSYRQQLLGMHQAWQIPRAVRRAAPECALLAFETPKSQAFWLKSRVVLPGWVRMEAPVHDGSGFDATSRFLSTRRMIKKYGLTMVSMKDAARFHEFFSSLYVPFIESRHGDTAIIAPLGKAVTEFIQADRELLLVKKGSEALGGAVLDF